MIDIHSHSIHSHDADYAVTEMCEAACKQGITIFSITDHYDMCDDQALLAEFDIQLKQSVANTRAARELYKDRLQLLVGIELGQPLENQAKSEGILDSYPFDFVLGALHNAPGRQDPYEYVSDEAGEDLEAELEAYFIALPEMIRWGRFDSAAHITYPFRYILRRQKRPYPFRRWDDHIEAAVQLLAEKELALELNTSGLRREPSYVMPDVRWVKRFRELGGEKLTIGADAHTPNNVGSGIAEGMDIAAKSGFRYLCYFVSRGPQYFKL